MPRRTLEAEFLARSRRLQLEAHHRMLARYARNHAGITIMPKEAPTMIVFKSRKFWAAVAAVLLAVAQEFIPDFPLDPGQFENVVLVLVAYILGTALEDGLRRQPVG